MVLELMIRINFRIILNQSLALVKIRVKLFAQSWFSTIFFSSIQNVKKPKWPKSNHRQFSFDSFSTIPFLNVYDIWLLINRLQFDLAQSIGKIRVPVMLTVVSGESLILFASWSFLRRVILSISRKYSTAVIAVSRARNFSSYNFW